MTSSRFKSVTNPVSAYAARRPPRDLISTHQGHRNAHVMIQETNNDRWDPFESIAAENSINQSLGYGQPQIDEKLRPLIQKQIKEFRTLKQLEETLKE